MIQKLGQNWLTLNLLVLLHSFHFHFTSQWVYSIDAKVLAFKTFLWYFGTLRNLLILFCSICAITFSDTINKRASTIPDTIIINGPANFWKSKVVPFISNDPHSAFGWLHLFLIRCNWPASLMSLIACSKNILYGDPCVIGNPMSPNLYLKISSI